MCDRQIARGPQPIEPRIEPPAVAELLVDEELRLDAVVLPMIDEIAPDAIVAAQKLEEHIARLLHPCRRWHDPEGHLENAASAKRIRAPMNP